MRHVILTGASRGIGATMLEGLLKEGYRVSTCSRSNSEFLDKVASNHEYKSRFFWTPCQVGEPEEVDQFVRNATDWAGEDGVWGLINNAGVAQAGILATFPNVESEKILKINLLGTIQMCHAVSPHLLRGSGGRIINISSIAGTRGYKGLAAYTAAKAGMDGLTRVLARELGGHQITVNSVGPGYVNTEMSSTLSVEQRAQIIKRTPLGRLATVDDIFRVVRFLLSDDAAFITGQTILVDGGFSC